MSKKLAALLFAIGVGASSVAMQAQASTCTRGCIILFNACIDGNLSEDCGRDLEDCMNNCG